MAFSQIRDYSQDIDALLLSKPATFKCEMTAMWQDHIGKGLMKSARGDDPAHQDDADVDDATVPCPSS